MRRIPFLAFLAAAFAAAPACGQSKLLRFPDIHGNTVVFSYAGDLWKASAKGGTATRLTAHSGEELFAKFSPDGKQIAFTGQYDGDEQVYVIPVTGGVPRQLTYYPARGPLSPRGGCDNQVYGWTPDGKGVLFRSFRDADGAGVETALYRADLEGGLPEKLPMPTAGAGDYSPDGKKVVYSPLFRDFRTWKRYQGGWAQDLYIFDLETHDARRIAESKRTERDPMWIGGDVYFVSDRDGILNLFRHDLANDKTEQLTRHKTWDVRWASSDGSGKIVYEHDGQLCVFDCGEKKEIKIAIRVPDDGLRSRPARKSVAGNIESYDLSPEGNRAVFVARGDVFTVPREKGPTRNLTASCGAHDRHAAWSPDGAKIAYISDATGEDEIYVIAQDGSGGPERLTEGFAAMLHGPLWSPDSKKIAFGDKDRNLYVVTLADKKLIKVARDPEDRIDDYSWSPDGAYLAFSMRGVNDMRSLYIWSLADEQLHRVTDDLTDESGPEWDPEGKYLFYFARREFTPQISTIEWNFAGNRCYGISCLALRKDVPHPLPPESDEAVVKKESDEKKEPADQKEAADQKKAGENEEADEDKAGEEEGKEEGEGQEEEKKDDEKKPQAIRIDFDGLAARAVRLPVSPGNLSGLSVTKHCVFYTDRGAEFYGRESYEKASLKVFEFRPRKESTFAGDVGGYALSADGKTALVKQGSSYKVYDAPPKPKADKTLSTQGLEIDCVPAEEWDEIFSEVHRRFRDFFYVRNMHGYDWDAIGKRYRELVPHVRNRADLNYLLGEMIAELNAGHCYVGGGDQTLPERPRCGLPGARFELDREAAYYRIAEIFPGRNEEPKYRAPLQEVGVDIRCGEYVLAIDGAELKGTDNPYRLLRHKTDPVTFLVNAKPEKEGAREVRFTPLSDESSLLYLRWVLGNLEKVTKATGGRVGYLHIPDMGAGGIAEFIKWYYPQIRKEGLVVDVRSNGGGNVSQWIIERLDNKLLGTRFGSTSDSPSTYPYSVFHGHLVCVLNECSASDGDIFPYYFREAGLGPLIGKRSWGGVVGISDRGPLLDGGYVFVPLNATNGRDGRYIIENHGVDPDIEVENDPKSVIAGQDPQLERAIKEVMERIEKNPKKLPERPKDPVRTR